MEPQITRNNHYVPQWYQRGFLSKAQHKLHVLNLDPSCTTLQNGKDWSEPELKMLSPKLAFKELDLYTTRLGHTLNDEIERFLFGEIDTSGAAAVRAWIAGDMVQIHRRFRDFFEYLDAQKLRTPKGLDWILRHYNGLSHLELMLQMQALRQMHATMWTECVREIVSAAKASVKFIVSDHPITIYHPDFPPDAPECQYPGDPGIEMVGSQTLFALDADHCLILTNIEYAEDPKGASTISRRTNARFRGTSMARTDAFIRGRHLAEDEVEAINHILKARARKYVAASDPAWLYPERRCRLPWRDIGRILLPREGLWKFGGETYIGHNDGTTSYRDKFGRSSKAHEFLAKEPLGEDLLPEADCGCGSGLAFKDCCSGVPSHKRPTWKALSIRERNLILCRGIRGILELTKEKTWLDVRRTFSNDHVRRINGLFASLWPEDTQLAELLPRPQSKRSRALHLGMVDAGSLQSNVLGLLPYFDELVVVHPFINAHGLRPEFSPIQSPANFKEQTLRNAVVLLLLESEIASGRIHLVPDPMDYDVGFREEIKAIVGSAEERGELGPIDAEAAKQLAHDEHMRAIKRLPVQELRAYLKQRMADAPEGISDRDLESIVKLLKRELEEDHLSLLDPPSSSEEGGELRTYKGFGRETGLFIAALTGSFIYTTSDTQWERLHRTDGVHHYSPDPEWAEMTRALADLNVEVPVSAFTEVTVPSSAPFTREFLREMALALQDNASVQTNPIRPTYSPFGPEKSKEMLMLKIHPSVPLGGFQRTDVSRLVLTFGRMDDIAPVRLAIFLEQQASGS